MPCITCLIDPYPALHHLLTASYSALQVLEAKHCYGTTSIEHPAVQMISWERGRIYLGGKVTGLELPKRYPPPSPHAPVPPPFLCTFITSRGSSSSGSGSGSCSGSGSSSGSSRSGSSSTSSSGYPWLQLRWR